MIDGKAAHMALAFSYIYSRAFASLALLTIKNARGEGMLFDVGAVGNIKKINIVILSIEFVIVSVLLAYFTKIYALLVCLTAGISYLYYIHKAQKEFGGITGDTEGWFIVSTEAAMALVIGLLRVILGWI